MDPQFRGTSLLWSSEFYEKRMNLKVHGLWTKICGGKFSANQTFLIMHETKILIDYTFRQQPSKPITGKQWFKQRGKLWDPGIGCISYKTWVFSIRVSPKFSYDQMSKFFTYL
jgi:hypothetical protein